MWFPRLRMEPSLWQPTFLWLQTRLGGSALRLFFPSIVQAAFSWAAGSIWLNVSGSWWGADSQVPPWSMTLFFIGPVLSRQKSSERWAFVDLLWSKEGNMWICLTLHTAQCTVRFCLIINSEEKPTSSYWLKVTDRRQADVFPMTSQDPLAMTLFVKYNRGRLLLKSCTKSFIGNITYNIQNIWIPKKILFSIILKGLNLKSY